MSVMTSTAVQAFKMQPALPPDAVYRLDVAQYHAMVRAGVLTTDDQVELLEGWLFPKMAKNPPHRIATRRTQRALETIVPAGWYVDAQEPITLADSEPEPDVCIVRGTTEDYPERNPGPPDIALVGEIADSTLERDRSLKRRMYARAGIPVYWIINLVEHQLEEYTTPMSADDSPDYQQRRDYSLTESVTIRIEGRDIGVLAVRELFP
jgi:Uma2 family endonuclease